MLYICFYDFLSKCSVYRILFTTVWIVPGSFLSLNVRTIAVESIRYIYLFLCAIKPAC